MKYKKVEVKYKAGRGFAFHVVPESLELDDKLDTWKTALLAFTGPPVLEKFNTFLFTDTGLTRLLQSLMNSARSVAHRATEALILLL